MVPAPVVWLIIFDTETTGLGAWDLTRLPNFPPHRLEMRASRAHWRPARLPSSRTHWSLTLSVLLPHTVCAPQAFLQHFTLPLMLCSSCYHRRFGLNFTRRQQLVLNRFFTFNFTFSPIPAKKWSFAWNTNRRRIVQGKKGPRRNQGKHCIESSNTEFGKTKAQGTRAVAYCKRTDYNGKRKRVAAIPDWRDQIPKRKDDIRSWMINNPESALC